MSAIGKKKAKPRTQNADQWMRALALSAQSVERQLRGGFVVRGGFANGLRNAHEELEGMHQRRPFTQHELDELLEVAVKAHHNKDGDDHNTKATINLLVRLGACKDKVRYYVDMYPNKYGYIKELWVEEKPLFPTEWKPVLMFTKTELHESAAQIKGMGPQRTEKIWRMMPFSSTNVLHTTRDSAIEPILMKLVELRGLESIHFYMEEYKARQQALAE